MAMCEEIGKKIAGLAGVPAAEVPDQVREHLAECRDCGRRLAAARLARAFLKSGAEEVEPPAGFAERIAESAFARPAPVRTEADLWRPAWGLVPAFGAVVVALLIVFQGSLASEPTGLFSTENLSAGERLVLGSSVPDADMILAAVFEGGGK